MTDSELSDVLLIEDTPSMARVYLEYLKRGPFRARHCMTGQEALDDIAKNPTDAVLLDLRLPDMDGLDVLKRIRSREFPVAVVVITADGSLNRAVEAMREGALDFLVKPFNADRLLITLGNVLERQRLNSMVESLSGHAGGENGNESKILPLHITERNAIEQAIRACDGNVVRAAGLLEISASTIYRKLATWHDVPNGEAAIAELHA
jgi:DNA-binding NtrC family response regulator